MPTIDSLTSSQLLALVHFIEACLRLRGSSNWRTIFYDCVRRGHFFPFARTDEAECLRQLLDDFGPLVVCQLKTTALFRAAQKRT